MAEGALMAISTHDPEVKARTLDRLWRIARGDGAGCAVDAKVERRAEALLERVWVSDVGSDESFCDSTFVTITGDGAVQFEWESGTVAIEAIVEPEGGFTIYVHPENGEPVEHAPVELADAVAVIAHGWSASGV